MNLRRRLLAIFASGFFLGVTIQAAYAEHHQAPVSVTGFNSGFADSKRDDCEQGFAAACQWLDAR